MHAYHVLLLKCICQKLDWNYENNVYQSALMPPLVQTLRLILSGTNRWKCRLLRNVEIIQVT